MDIREIVINCTFGGFGLPKEALDRYAQLSGCDRGDVCSYELDRDDPILVQVVREFGLTDRNKGSDRLAIIRIPADEAWEIQDYDGAERLTSPLIDLEDKYAHLQDSTFAGDGKV